MNQEAQVEWGKYLEASTIEEKISHLERFLGVCVKHNGVEKHLAMAKTKLKKLKAQQFVLSPGLIKESGRNFFLRWQSHILKFTLLLLGKVVTENGTDI